MGAGEKGYTGVGGVLPVSLERIGVIIGKNGSNKERLEKAFRVKIFVDSENCFVKIVPGPDASPLDVLKAQNAVRAIAHGFSVDDALLLTDDNYLFDLIDIRDYARNENELKRIVGRVIGERGKTKRIIQELAKVRMVVFRNRFVGLIGPYENVTIARQAVEMICQGAPHRAVYRFLRLKHGELKRRSFILWEGGSLKPE